MQELAAEDLTANKTLQHLDRFFKLYHSTVSMRVLELAAGVTVLEFMCVKCKFRHSCVCVCVCPCIAVCVNVHRTVSHIHTVHGTVFYISHSDEVFQCEDGSPRAINTIVIKDEPG